MKRPQKETKPKARPEKGRNALKIMLWIIIGILTPAVLIGIYLLAGMNNRLEITHYEVKTGKLKGRIRLVQVSDLHSNFYGEGQEAILTAVFNEEPDAVVITGDLFDHRMTADGAEAFLKGVSGKVPVYYVTGNHEYYKGFQTYLKHMDVLERYEVRRLSGQAYVLQKDGDQIWIAGVDDHYAGKMKGTQAEWITTGFQNEMKAVKAITDDGHFSVLLSHRPEKMEDYAAYGFDLVLSGHAHGGQWRIPGTNQGIYAPGAGLFPKYTGGTIYEADDTKMIVSRGLARDALYQPRAFNRPELVVIDLIGEEAGE